MIGFDRPLKPEWIIQTLQLLEVGTTPAQYYEAFESIAKELVGKEGKRKVRTIIFRSFIYSLQNQTKTIENNPFIDWAQRDSQAQLQPLLLVKLLMDYGIARFIIQKLDTSFSEPGVLSTELIKKRMIQQYGDRDIVKRSVRSFLDTLGHFKVLEKCGTNKYKIIKKYSLADEQIVRLLQLYAQVFIRSRIVDLDTMDSSLLYFFSPIDFLEIARKYHGQYWEFIRDANRNQLLMK